MQGRSSIHFGVFLVAGLLVTSISLVTLNQGTAASPEAMQLFAGIGGLFFLIGLAKFIAKKIKDISAGEKELENKIAGINMQRPQAKKVVISCPRCGAKNYSTSNFCHMCGLRLQ